MSIQPGEKKVAKRKAYHFCPTSGLHKVLVCMNGVAAI